ncbi:MAG: hypothetical protein BWY76_00631 [bacterium ADurb.Bin429]|nr:MAG: hypothetical protein BWY76_00631 [bacterium ADurb.Bin429]
MVWNGPSSTSWLLKDVKLHAVRVLPQESDAGTTRLRKSGRPAHSPSGYCTPMTGVGTRQGVVVRAPAFSVFGTRTPQSPLVIS